MNTFALLIGYMLVFGGGFTALLVVLSFLLDKTIRQFKLYDEFIQFLWDRRNK